MLGKNLTLSSVVHDPAICDARFLGLPPLQLGPLSIDLGTYGAIHVDTLALTLFSMALILGFALIVRPGLTSERPGGIGQHILEMYYEFMEDLTKGQMGDAYKTFMPLIASMFIFILIGNFVGVGPWKFLEEIPGWPKLADGELFELASPTTDFNITMGLATISLLTYVGSGFWAHGLGYIKTYLGPMFIIEMMDLIIRPATLALRLMIVITADELLRAAAITMVPALVPTGVMGFELFIGLIQAFVFTLLTTIYIGLTVSHH
jgi:F-type H+-transporting ATPase subunit a